MKRLFLIFLFVLLMVATIIVWSYSYGVSHEEAYVPVAPTDELPIIPSEEGVFRRSEHALDYTKMPVDENHYRTLKTYYDNKAYHGAPPSIPHEVADERNMGNKSCLKCHENGGFAEKYNAYAPVTPHPEKINCRQCHVPEKTQSLFKGTNWEKMSVPKVGNAEMPGSPPIIPHQIQLRENCLACHAGPSAPKEIRVSHPERVNCRQCHVLNNKVTTDIGTFSRNK